MIKVNCLNCSKEFLTHNCWIKKGGGKFCSRSCATAYNVDASVLRMNKAKEILKSQGKIIGGRLRLPKIKKVCPICANEFEVYLSAKDQKTCSLKCRSGLKTPRKPHKKPGSSGDKHYNWKGGKSHPIRDKIEHTYWRNAVLERDGFTCINCGAKKEEGHRIEVDHIKPISTHPELAFDLENGRTLCAPCHRKTDSYGLNKKHYKK